MFSVEEELYPFDGHSRLPHPAHENRLGFWWAIMQKKQKQKREQLRKAKQQSKSQNRHSQLQISQLLQRYMTKTLLSWLKMIEM